MWVSARNSYAFCLVSSRTLCLAHLLVSACTNYCLPGFHCQLMTLAIIAFDKAPYCFDQLAESCNELIIQMQPKSYTECAMSNDSCAWHQQCCVSDSIARQQQPYNLTRYRASHTSATLIYTSTSSLGLYIVRVKIRENVQSHAFGPPHLQCPFVCIFLPKRLLCFLLGPSMGICVWLRQYVMHIIRALRGHRTRCVATQFSQPRLALEPRGFREHSDVTCTSC